jgi:4'-phosphopantetheinyl transferase
MAWLPDDRAARVAPGQVHVWLADLDEFEGERRGLELTLSPDESDRAGRFCFEEHRFRYVVARGLLRALLGRELDVHPSEVRFAYGAHGKPRLDGDAGRLAFNVSHSGGFAVYALGHEGPIGVDIEAHRPISDRDEIAARFFAPGERRRLRDVPEARRGHAFFDCWARKEAFVKAVGEGLSHPLDRFEVSVDPRCAACLLAVDDDPDEAGRWTLAALPAISGHSAALAVRQRGLTITCRTLAAADEDSRPVSLVATRSLTR